eukprot:NODE_8161_length_530_cov_2.862786_g7107_i0.p3 GENE.NODE_8161_length_530_cov_2.862786_g7107_i0~~NODE_8161_length_530_cov_2.862786_g7107_i0.p3  ORF type:complete len:64 (+),score=1.84 NODE_8161_length_530_cov_2.862786_g7107_i0:110-301(+)
MAGAGCPRWLFRAVWASGPEGPWGAGPKGRFPGAEGPWNSQCLKGPAVCPPKEGIYRGRQAPV